MLSSSESECFEEDKSIESAMSWQTIGSDSSIVNLAIATAAVMHTYNNENVELPKRRTNKSHIKRVEWDDFWNQKLTDSRFEQDVRMTRQSFIKLVDLLRPNLEVDMRMGALRGGGIVPEVAVYVTLRYLGGGSKSDIRNNVGISATTIHELIYKTCKVIINCNELDIVFPTTVDECQQLSSEFQQISPNGCIINCVGAVDGYLLSLKPVTRFTYFDLAAPGSANDRYAIKEKNCNGISLSDAIESLPPGYVVIGDPAYECTEHLVSMYYGNQRNNILNNNFNYAASTCRIRIEMAFGLMNTKWGILHRPWQQRLRNVKYIAFAIARLHNYCITERLQRQQHESEWDTHLPYVATIPNEERNGIDMGPEFPRVLNGEVNEYRHINMSQIRISMAREVRRCGVERPTSSVLHPDHNSLQH